MRGALIGIPTTGNFVEVCVVALMTQTAAQRRDRLSYSAAPPQHTLEEKQSWGGREGGGERGGRGGGREGGEGEREGGRERGREGGREGGRERGTCTIRPSRFMDVASIMHTVLGRCLTGFI